MENNKVTKKTAKKKAGKENAVPELLSNSLLDNILGDNINDVVGRRSDVGKRSLLLATEDSIDETLNDDELEKEERRREQQEKLEREKAAAARQRPTGLGIIGTLTPEELDQHYSKCIEMCNRNKVNVKNAFKLQLIDYMKMIVSNKSNKSENLTLMSCTLSASAKIYGIRVDKVYTDMVKILSGKAAEIQKDESDDENPANDDEANEGEEVNVRRRRKADGSSDEEEDTKEVNYEAMLLTEAQLNKGKHVDDDPQELPTLPKGLEYFLECRQLDPDGRFCLNPPVFQTGEIENTTNTPLLIDFPHYSGNYEKLDPCEYIDEYKNIRKCFSILDDKNSEESMELMNSSLAFDPSSNVPDSIMLDQDDNDIYGDAVEPEPAGPDYDDDEIFPEPDMSNDLRSGQVSTIQPKSFTAETMAKLVSVNAGDYSYFDNSRIDFWAGPRHWKLKRQRGGEKIQMPGEKPNKKTVKKSCDLSYSAASLSAVKKHYGDVVNTLLAHRTMSTWSSKRTTVPQEISYSQKSLLSLMKNNQLSYVKKDSSTNMISKIDLKSGDDDDTVFTPDDFGMDMDRDGDDDDDDDMHEPAAACPEGLGEGPSPMIHLDEPNHDEDNELIAAPQKVNKISLKYAKAQKRIDIKRLKNTMWDCLDLESKNEEKEKEVKFSEVYSVLPTKLPSDDAAELSFPIAFMALLHMANEKNLALSGNEDNSEVFVKLG